MSDRVNWVDNLKAIGIIILITIAHTDQYRYIILYERTILMPIFFFISGFLFKTEKYPTFGILIKKFSKTLLIPYLFFGMLVIVASLIMNVYLLGIQEVMLSLKSYLLIPIQNLLIGNVRSLSQIHNGPLWFLPCLFVVKIIFWWIEKISKNDLQLVAYVLIIMTLGYLTKYLPFNEGFPFSVNTAMIVTIFFAAGNLIRPYSNFVSYLKLWMILIVILIHIFLVIIINKEAFWAINSFGNPLLTLLASFLGILTFVYISDKMKPNKITNFISKNTLTIFALHYPMLAVMKKLLLPYFISKGFYWENIRFREINFDFQIHTKLFMIAILFGILQLLVVFPVVKFLRKNFPVLIGLKRK